ARLGADAARGLRRGAPDLPEGLDEGAGELAGAHQRRLHLPEEAHLRGSDRAPLQGDPPRQRQEGHAVRAFLPRPGLPAARDVRGRADFLPEDAQARAQPDRGLLRAGPRLLVRGRSRPGAAGLGGGVQGEQVQPLGQEMSGHPAGRAAGRGAAAHLALLALLALRWRVGRRLPLWFEEGYAAVAAAEWDRLDALRLNWQVARGAPLDLDEVDRALRSDGSDATTAYALATTAVLLLARWGGPQGLGPLIDRLARDPSFDAALRATYQVTEGDFAERWQRDVRSRYGWLSWAGAVGRCWAV